MKDRVVRGAIAGVAGGILMNIWSSISYNILPNTKLRYLDWASIMLFGDLPKRLHEVIFALFIQLVLTAFIGVIFALLVPKITSRYYLIKGVVFAIIVYFIMYSIPILFKIPHLSKMSFNTAFSNFIGGVIWGIVTPLVLDWLDKKAEIK